MRFSATTIVCLYGMTPVTSFTSKSFLGQRRYTSSPSKNQDSTLFASTHPYFADIKTGIPDDKITKKISLDISKEISSGKILNGHVGNNDNTVIDFGSVMDHTSRAEIALRDAKEKYLASPPPPSIGGRLMGINDQVVKEVGREIGNFAPSDEFVQRTASYLRSLAPPSFFRPTRDDESDETLFRSEEIKEYTDLLSRSYQESGDVTEAFAKTFHLGTTLLPDDAARSIWAIYVWCRRTDEIVDAPRDSDEEMLSDLSAWEHRLERLFEYGEVKDVLDLALLDVKIRYPALSIQPFLDMIRGMLMDIPGLGVERYGTFEELHLYCYRVAGTVGLMSMPIFGCAEGFTEEIAKEPALSLGVAFQITNILRDVGEDATTRNRIYLPLSSLEEFNVTETQIYSQTVDDNYRALMKREIQRARDYYKKARTGVPMLSPYSRLPVQVSLDCYEKILDKIEENGYDSLTKRAYVSKWEKLATVPFSWYRTQDISKVLPLPGDDRR